MCLCLRECLQHHSLTEYLLMDFLVSEHRQPVEEDLALNSDLLLSDEPVISL